MRLLLVLFFSLFLIACESDKSEDIKPETTTKTQEKEDKPSYQLTESCWHDVGKKKPTEFHSDEQEDELQKLAKAQPLCPVMAIVWEQIVPESGMVMSKRLIFNRLDLDVLRYSYNTLGRQHMGTPWLYWDQVGDSMITEAKAGDALLSIGDFKSGTDNPYLSKTTRMLLDKFDPIY